ncbi:MAG: SCO family protein [Candidatus Limnocylindrales bacterium]
MTSLRPLRHSRRTVTLTAIAAAVIVLAAGSLGWVVTQASSPPVTGVQADQAVPVVPLIDEQGGPTSLAALQGRYVVLAPFLTLCHETCPITTGSFLEMRQAVAAAGLANRVDFVEITVDPGRDIPARLRAYAKLTGATWTLLTGTPDNLASLWRFFGVDYEREPEGSPPNIDWWTGQPETYDVGHSDAVFFLDTAGRERIAMAGQPDVGGQLDATLTSLLDTEGLEQLQHPEGAWTVPQALDDLGHLLGRAIPAPAS